MRTITPFMSLRIAAALAFGLITTVPAVQGQAEEHAGHRQHGAHVHGLAQLNLVVDGENIFLELTSPAMNIVGFEHSPSTADQQHTVHEAAEKLADGDSLFSFSSAAACRLISVEVDSPLMNSAHHGEHGHSDTHGEDHDDAEVHSEFEVRYQFSCTHPGKLESLKVGLFSAFPGLEQIEAQTLSAAGQSGGRLNAGNDRLHL